MRALSLTLAAALLVGLALPAAAQDAPAGSPPAPEDSVRCFDCAPRDKRFLLASAQMFGAWLAPWSVNKFVRKGDFANVSPSTWWDNLTGKWEWDDNSFGTNQFAHPYHGNLYFNAFRANGYDFWASSAAAWVGAFVWECCGETHPPAPNDLINTAMGGMSLGEMFFRSAGLALDNTTTGGERVLREAGAFVLNPQRGFSRLVNGHMGAVAPNAPEEDPDLGYVSVDLGFNHFDDQFQGATIGDKDAEEDAALLRLGLLYGDPVSSAGGSPFSHFQVNGDILLTGGVSIFRLETRGSLWGKRLEAGYGDDRHFVGSFLNYDYMNHTTAEFGMQSVTGGLHSQWQLTRNTRLVTEVLARGIAIAGVRTPEYIITGEGRDYDYGPGLGGRIDAGLLVHEMGGLKASYEENWFRTVNGAGANHQIRRLNAEMRTQLTDQFGLSISWFYLTSWTGYEGYPRQIQKTRQWTFTVTSAFPGWSY